MRNATNEPGGFREKSVAELWRPLARFVAVEARIGQAASKSPFWRFVYEFVRFGVKQAWACLFAGLMVALVITTRFVWPVDAPITRYDFIFLSAVAIQIFLVRFNFESRREVMIIFVFHVVGTVMEIFKTAKGSWIYPEAAFFRIGGVPLFTGFMYACIGSYMMRAFALFDFRFSRHPPVWQVGVIAAAIYANFFLHHYIWDFRVILFIAVAVIFWPTTIYYRIHHSWRRMPLLLAAFLSALFIWVVENIGTFTHVWLYPDQLKQWSMVGPGKLGAWFLLQIISYALVISACPPQPVDDGPIQNSRARHADRMGRSGATPIKRS